MSFFQRNAKYIVVIAVVLGSTSGIFGKLITASPMAIGFFRLSFALPFFAIPVIAKQRARLINLPPRDIMISFLGGVFLAGHFFSWYTAVQSTNIASAVVLAALQPLVVIPATIFIFKRQVPLRQVVSILIALIGAGVVAGADYQFAQENFFGDIMALITAACIGVYFVIGKMMRDRVPAGIYIFIVFLACWMCFAIGMIVTDTPFVGYKRMDWLWIIAMTIVCQLGTHAVLNWSFAYVSSLYVSAWTTFEIVTATIFAFLIFGEVPTGWQIAGAMLVVGGLVCYNRFETLNEKGRKEELHGVQSKNR